jgi:hypothetical protein
MYCSVRYWSSPTKSGSRDKDGYRANSAWISEQKSRGRFGVHQRLYAQAVARERQALLLPVPHGESEHSAQVGEAALEPLTREKAQQHLGIRVAAKTLALRLERVTELLEVVDLPVENDDVTSVGRRHRLVPRLGQIDDGEPPESQPRFSFAPGPFVVGPAMLQAIDRFGDAHLAARCQHRARDPAHQAPP